MAFRGLRDPWSAARHIAEMLREAAVLLAVLGPLEKVTLGYRLTGRFVASVVCLATFLLAAGILIDDRSPK